MTFLLSTVGRTLRNVVTSDSEKEDNWSKSDIFWKEITTGLSFPIFNMEGQMSK
jgi:hypothetical protein